MKLADIPNPTAVFFQPARYLPMLADIGVTVAFGPEVENSRAMTATELAFREEQWMLVARALGIGVVIKRPWKYAALPDNVVGFCHTVDEPNAKKIAPAALQAEFDQLRAIDPSMPIFLSLFGGAITSANLARAAELQLLRDYAALCDVATVDAYSANVNAKTHPPTWTGDACKKWIDATGKPVWAWVEMNDQQLPPPKPVDGFNRGPTAEEIKATVDDAVAKGASGVGWFATAQNGKYGWGIIDPAKGDSYWPLVDRTGASIKPQLDMVKSIGLARKPLPIDPITAKVNAIVEAVRKLDGEAADARAELAAVKELTRALTAAAREEADAAKASADAARAELAGFRDAIVKAAATTQPSN